MSSRTRSRSRDRLYDRPCIMFVINSIGTGGAERALDTILRAAGERHARCDLHLVLLDDEPERRALPALGARHCLDAKGSLLRSVVRLDRLLARLRPDLVVSLLVRANVATALAGPRHARATVLCERMHLGSHLAGRYRGLRHLVLRWLPRLLYARADRVLAVSDGVRDDLVAEFGLPPSLVVTIPNGYDPVSIGEAGARTPEIDLPPVFAIAVGRLVEAKGFATLIEAWRRAAPAFPLLILGEGPQRANLLERIAAAGLEGQVRLLGYLDNPFAAMARARFLVSASHNEGFPNAIAETMTLGRPVIATDCPSGPAELLGAPAGAAGQVVTAPYGLIVPDGDITGLAAAIGMLSGKDSIALRNRLGAAAEARMADFDVSRVASRYWRVFDDLAGGIA